MARVRSNDEEAQLLSMEERTVCLPSEWDLRHCRRTILCSKMGGALEMAPRQASWELVSLSTSRLSDSDERHHVGEAPSGGPATASSYRRCCNS